MKTKSIILFLLFYILFTLTVFSDPQLISVGKQSVVLKKIRYI